MKDREAREQINHIWRRINSLREELGAATDVPCLGPAIFSKETRNLGKEIDAIKLRFDSLLEYLGLAMEIIPAPHGRTVIRKQEKSSARNT